MRDPLNFGYVRVSSKDQNEERQLIAMGEAGVDKCRIYVDKESGKDFNRPAYMRLLRALRKDDTLFVQSIDRFGRNYDEILEQWRYLTKKGVCIVVLDMPLLDTRKDRDLTGRLIADIVLQLLSYVAQTEREFIKKRQAEGIAAAKIRGVHFGRNAIERTPEMREALAQYRCGEISAREAARRCGVSHSCIIKWARTGHIE